MRSSVGATTGAASSLLHQAPWLPERRRPKRRPRRVPAPPAVATLLVAVAAATAASVVATAAVPPASVVAAAQPPSAFALAAARDAVARARLSAARDSRLRAPASAGPPSSAPTAAVAAAAAAANAAAAKVAALTSPPATSGGLLYDGSYAALAYAGVSLVGAVAAMCAVGGGLLGLWADGAALAAGDEEEVGLWEGPDEGLDGDDVSGEEDEKEATDYDTDMSIDEEAIRGGAAGDDPATMIDPESLCVRPDVCASPAEIYTAAGFVSTPTAGRAGMLGVSELALDAVAAAAGGGLAAATARCRHRRRSNYFGGRRLGGGGAAVAATKGLDVSSLARA
ncbi:hypothetical protein MMPV_005976 [Pyropia vietnamensis]